MATRATLLALFVLSASAAQASIGRLSAADQSDYELLTSSHGWTAPPATSFRVFLDFYNVFDFFDSEPNADSRLFDRSVLADTVRPVVTLLWAKRFRFQAGLIAERIYGGTPDFASVDPWIQALWTPAPHLFVTLGNLEIPHGYLSPLFYAPRYFLFAGQNNEKGLQLLRQTEAASDDLFLNYRQTETASRQEMFDFGFVHHNDWKIFHFTYQAHWTHTGGDNFPHAINTVNDSAQAAGLGLRHRLYSTPWIVGANFYYLHSHYRTDSDAPALSETTNGDGRYWQGYARYSRLKLVYGYWRGHNFMHADGDDYFRTNLMRLGIIHWDILLSPDFNLFGEAVGYFIGNNSLGYSQYVKPTFLIQLAWHFAVPSRGWRVGEPRGADDGALPIRWDAGF